MCYKTTGQLDVLLKGLEYELVVRAENKTRQKELTPMHCSVQK